MTDYRPKTEYVKDSSVWFRDEVTADAARLEFDRWLDEHDREVIREFINQQVEYVRNVMASEETE